MRTLRREVCFRSMGRVVNTEVMRRTRVLLVGGGEPLSQPVADFGLGFDGLDKIFTVASLADTFGGVALVVGVLAEAGVLALLAFPVRSILQARTSANYVRKRTKLLSASSRLARGLAKN